MITNRDEIVKYLKKNLKENPFFSQRKNLDSNSEKIYLKQKNLSIINSSDFPEDNDITQNHSMIPHRENTNQHKACSNFNYSLNEKSSFIIKNKENKINYLNSTDLGQNEKVINFKTTSFYPNIGHYSNDNDNQLKYNFLEDPEKNILKESKRENSQKKFFPNDYSHSNKFSNQKATLKYQQELQSKRRKPYDNDFIENEFSNFSDLNLEKKFENPAKKELRKNIESHKKPEQEVTNEELIQFMELFDEGDFQDAKKKKNENQKSSTLAKIKKEEELSIYNLSKPKKTINKRDFLDYLEDINRSKKKIAMNYIKAIPSEWSKHYSWEGDLIDANFQIFEHEGFRENQKQIINASKSGRDVFGCMPTGGGKSLLFQLPAIIEDGVSIIIMPLVSLIYDQELFLRKLDVPIIVLSSDIDLEKISSQFASIFSKHPKRPKIIFVTPEKLNKSQHTQNKFRELYHRNLINRFVIDEAHCVSSWGHDFREDYLNLKQLRINYPHVPILALTATATEEVRIDIINQLRMNNTLYFQSSFNRTNLMYEVIKKQKATYIKDMFNLIKIRFPKESGIIYCPTIKNIEILESELQDLGLNCAAYHAKLPPKQKSQVQNDWMENRIQVIIATVAFGMGINKPDVRFVINSSIARSIENYYQESGRAGRDGKLAYCILFFSEGDRSTYDFFLTKSNMDKKRLNQSANNTTEMVRYGSNTINCRRKLILKYFGEEFDDYLCNYKCDICLSKKNKQNNNYTCEEIECRKIIEDLEHLFKNQKFSESKPTLIQLSKFLFKNKNNSTTKSNSFSSFDEKEIKYILRELIYNKILKEQFHIAYNRGIIKLEINYKYFNLYMNNTDCRIVILKNIKKSNLDYQNDNLLNEKMQMYSEKNQGLDSLKKKTIQVIENVKYNLSSSTQLLPNNNFNESNFNYNKCNELNRPMLRDYISKYKEKKRTHFTSAIKQSIPDENFADFN